MFLISFVTIPINNSFDKKSGLILLLLLTIILRYVILLHIKLYILNLYIQNKASVQLINSRSMHNRLKNNLWLSDDSDV